MIGQDYIAELTRRTDITELVGSYVELKRSGRMEKGLCPFHNEKTPSFYVYPDTSSFYCFGCGAGGDAVSFIKRIQNLSYVEAVKFLAARAGMPLPDEDDDDAKKRGSVLAINRETARFYAACLNSDAGSAVRAYLRKRQLTDATIRKFGLGYSPDEFGSLLNHLRNKGYSEQDLLDAGVCKRSQKGSVYDTFRGRLMFPILDSRGNVIAFGARQMGDQGPKYLNSGDTKVFKKSRNLFALGLARKSSSRRFLLAEGYMDVISLHQAGFDTAVATLGTAITPEQAKLISDYADEVVICYDSDEAGQKATARAISVLKNTPLKIVVLKLDGAKDPDEFIGKFGKEKFAMALDGSGNTIEYALSNAKRDFDLGTEDGRSRYISKALEILAREAKPAEQDIYAGRIAEETDVSKQNVMTQLEAVNRNRWKQIRKEKEKRMREESTAASINIPYEAGGAKALGVAFAEQQLVAALLKNPEDYYNIVLQHVSPQQFITPDMKQAYELITQKELEDLKSGLAALSGELPENTISLLGRVLAMNHGIGFSKADVKMFIERIEDGSSAADKAAEMTPEELERHIESLRERKQ